MTDRNDRIVIFAIIASVLLFLFLTGTMTSGYHFVDDHEVIKIKNDLKTSSLTTVCKSWINEDLNTNKRFRPFYFANRVFETYMFGSDFLLWAMYNAILCCLALIFCYLAMRNLNFSSRESILFLIIAFIGPQITVWWRLGPGESLGMMFLGLSFYFLTRSIVTKKYNLNNLIFVFFVILLSLIKESFLIIIPALIVFKIWNEKIYLWSSWKESVYRNLVLIITLIVCAAEVLIIRYYISSTYSVLDKNDVTTLTNVSSTIFRFVRTYLNLILVGIFLFFYARPVRKFSIKFNIQAFIFFLLILLPNTVLYAKSGMVERYLLPASFGLAFFIVSVINRIDQGSEKLRKAAFIVVVIAFIPYVYNSVAGAIKFTKEGNSTGLLLSAISKNYKDSSQIMVIVDPVKYEKSVSLKSYLLYEDKIDLYGFMLMKDSLNPVHQVYAEAWKSYFEGHQFENLTSKPDLLIFLDNKLVDGFFNKTGLPLSNYTPINVGTSTFALYKENI